MSFAVVVALDEARGIGRDGALPWRLPGDLAFFKRLTTTTQDPSKQNAVVMGRLTWESLPPKFRPLPGRVNVVLSRAPGFVAPGALGATSLEDALAELGADATVEEVFVIGGGQLYASALAHPECRTLHVTRVEGSHPSDAFFPPIPGNFERTARSERHEEGGIGYVFETWQRA